LGDERNDRRRIEVAPLAGAGPAPSARADALQRQLKLLAREESSGRGALPPGLSVFNPLMLPPAPAPGEPRGNGRGSSRGSAAHRQLAATLLPFVAAAPSASAAGGPPPRWPRKWRAGSGGSTIVRAWESFEGEEEAEPEVDVSRRDDGAVDGGPVGRLPSSDGLLGPAREAPKPSSAAPAVMTGAGPAASAPQGRRLVRVRLPSTASQDSGPGTHGLAAHASAGELAAAGTARHVLMRGSIVGGRLASAGGNLSAAPTRAR